MPSDFNKSKPYSPAFSFGLSREASKVYVEGSFVADPTIPGPGAYGIPSVIGNEAKKFTLRGRTADHLELANTATKNPGPGTYVPKTTFSKDGKYFYSRFKNSCSVT